MACATHSCSKLDAGSGKWLDAMKKPAQPDSGQAASAISVRTTPWWTGGTLRAGARGLEIAGQRAEVLAAELGTPLYLYDGARVREQLACLRDAPSGFALQRIYY